jgi:hypothetical protein
MNIQGSRLGDDSEEDTPVPIPNTEVKLFSADGSWGPPPARVGRCRAFDFYRRGVEHARIYIFEFASAYRSSSCLNDHSESGMV